MNCRDESDLTFIDNIVIKLKIEVNATECTWIDLSFNSGFPNKLINQNKVSYKFAM